MSNFVNQFKTISDITETENCGLAFKSTGSDLLSLFANIGGMRDREEAEIINLWRAARNEDKELADNLILYSRDIRAGGLGERKIGRILLKELAKIDPNKVERNLQKIVDIGRWDDLFALEATPVWRAVINFIEEQLKRDIIGAKKNEPISLLAKWMPSINASSKETKRLANKICNIFDLKPKTYRKCLSKLRQHIDVVERKMSAGDWDSINFETVPSLAMSRYINTYNNHCSERFEEYKAGLISGEKKVNAETLYPYDIVKKYFIEEELDLIDEAQWNALPNYVSEENQVVIMADVSGSMTSPEYRPISTSIGLATYFAQRNKGAYHGIYLTFTDEPHFINIEKMDSLESCLDYVRRTGIGYSTNLDLAFKEIYKVAKLSNEAPKALICISDMEIDCFLYDNYDSIIEKWRKEFEKINLKMPKVIWWNVNSRAGRVLSRMDENVAFVSGYGAGPFKNLTSLIEKDAYKAMVEILSKKEFQWN